MAAVNEVSKILFFDAITAVTACNDRIKSAGGPTFKETIVSAINDLFLHLTAVVQVYPQKRRHAFMLQCQLISKVANKLISNNPKGTTAGDLIDHCTKLKRMLQLEYHPLEESLLALPLVAGRLSPPPLNRFIDSGEMPRAGRSNNKSNVNALGYIGGFN